MTTTMATIHASALLIACAWSGARQPPMAPPLGTERDRTTAAKEGPTCTPEERREALRSTQEHVLAAAPREVESLDEAVLAGGPLEGWRLSHGLVVLAGAGGVAVDNLDARDPLPQVLLYAPSPDSSPADWLDFDGPDGPYHLVGWAYLAPYESGSTPPRRECIEDDEWFAHEAGWHLLDGGMHLTPGAVTEPDRPDLDVGFLFWHPRVWSIHFWRGQEGEPTVAFNNPEAPTGGVRMPEGSFFRMVDGRPEPLTAPPDESAPGR